MVSTEIVKLNTKGINSIIQKMDLLALYAGAFFITKMASNIAHVGIRSYLKNHPSKSQLETRLFDLHSIPPKLLDYRRFDSLNLTQKKNFLESLGYKYPMTKPELIDEIKVLEDKINKKVKVLEQKRVLEDKINKKVKDQEIKILQQKLQGMKNP